jgi:drug/metabolite transporter (DMT)-like permease
MRRATGFGAGAQALLGSSFAVSAALTHYPFAAGQAGRYLLAAIALLAVGRARGLPLHRPGPRDLARLALLAATGLVAFNWCLLGALRHGTPAAVGVIVGGTPLVLAVLGPARVRSWPRGRVVGAAGAVVLGVVLVEGAGAASATGLLLATGTLACEVAFTLVAEPLLPRYGPLAVSAYSCLLAVPELVLIAPLTDQAARWPTGQELAALTFLGGALTTVAFISWYRCVAELGADRAGLLSGVVPVSALLTGVLLGRDRLGPLPLLGTLAVGAGVLIGLTGTRRYPPARVRDEV